MRQAAEVGAMRQVDGVLLRTSDGRHYDHLGNPIAVFTEEVPSLEKDTRRVLDESRIPSRASRV